MKHVPTLTRSSTAMLALLCAMQANTSVQAQDNPPIQQEEADATPDPGSSANAPIQPGSTADAALESETPRDATDAPTGSGVGAATATGLAAGGAGGVEVGGSAASGSGETGETSSGGIEDDEGPRPAFELDPVMDGAILGGGLVIGLTLEQILGTGELRPQEPVDEDLLIGIDRDRAKSDNVSGEGLSDIFRGALFVYTVSDTLLVDLLDRGDPWYHYAVIYLESYGITFALTDITKMAVRRPRPLAYKELRELERSGEEPSMATDRALSFVSGHASVSAALSATAIYFAFSRPASALERWLVFSGGIILTTLVSVQRVAEGKHFPTDVIAGAAMGGSIGLIVPHLHRVDDDTPSRLRVTGFRDGDSAGLALRGLF